MRVIKKDVPFFSIIMPTYNSEKYIAKAIHSILNQTFPYFELLIVDDFSTDDSYNFCLDMAEKDNRIHVFRTHSNQGAATARNIGLSHACGEYITFIDSDDFVDIDLLYISYQNIKTKQIDYLKYGCIEEYIGNDGKIVYRRFCRVKKRYICSINDIHEQAVATELVPLFGYVWNGFYKFNIIKKFNIKFNQSYPINEDFDFNINANLKVYHF